MLEFAVIKFYDEIGLRSFINLRESKQRVEHTSGTYFINCYYRWVAVT